MKIATIYRNCAVCDKDIVIVCSFRENQKFCSHSCNTKYQNKHRVYKDSTREKISAQRKIDSVGKNNPNYRNGTNNTTLKCELCLNDFTIPKSSLRGGKHSGKFCSSKCYDNFRLNRKASKPMDDLNRAFRRNICKSIRSTSNRSENKWFDLIGYSYSDLRHHLESMFSDGMNWENYGKWHIDHIKPVSFFDFTTESCEDFKLCWSLSNLQPLWAKDNISKGGINRKHNRIKYGNE